MTHNDTAIDVVIEPVEQKRVALTEDGGDEVLAASTETSEIYLPVKPICTALGVSWTTHGDDSPCSPERASHHQKCGRPLLL